VAATTTTATSTTTTTATTTTTTPTTVALTNGQAAPQNPAPLSPRTRLGEELPQGLLNDCEHLPKYRRDLVAKLKALRAELTALQPQSGHCRLEVSRNEVFEESYRLIMKMRPKDMRKRLMVKFKGGRGVGLRRGGEGVAASVVEGDAQPAVRVVPVQQGRPLHVADQSGFVRQS
jgi:E3 ubiquitin ligase SMURF1/2